MAWKWNSAVLGLLTTFFHLWHTSYGLKQKDLSLHSGNIAFFLQDPTDGQCVGPQGFSVCDESAVWILTPRMGSKNYSFVTLFASSSKGLCLDLKKRWFGDITSIGLGSCGSRSAKDWNFQLIGSEGIILTHGDVRLTRGIPFHNSIAATSWASELRYQPTTIHDAGFFIKSSDGLCFDGDYFRPCTNPASLLWGVGIKYNRRGEGKRFIHNFKDHNICLESKGSRVYRGSCQSRFALGWSLSQGKLQYESGHLLNRYLFGEPQCVVRKEIDVRNNALSKALVNATGEMRPCQSSFEYLLMELPSTFSPSDLQKILKEDTERLSEAERQTIEDILTEMSGGDIIPAKQKKERDEESLHEEI